MPEFVHFSVAGTPVPWARARRNGNRYFTEARVAAYMQKIRTAAEIAGARPLQCPCTLVVTAFLPIPRSWSRKKREGALEGLVTHTVKPDWDNLGKIVSDALNGIAWNDDAQVFWANVKKVYSENPSLEVTVCYERNT